MDGSRRTSDGRADRCAVFGELSWRLLRESSVFGAFLAFVVALFKICVALNKENDVFCRAENAVGGLGKLYGVKTKCCTQ